VKVNDGATNVNIDKSEVSRATNGYTLPPNKTQKLSYPSLLLQAKSDHEKTAVFVQAILRELELVGGEVFVILLSHSGVFVELSTFMIAFPAVLTNASCCLAASGAVTKLQQKVTVVTTAQLSGPRCML
jgi:hypothetical protein